MATTLANLRVTREGLTGEADRARVVRMRAALPGQRRYGGEAEEAALRFGLPMSGQEIHERVRLVLWPKVAWPADAWIGMGLMGLLTVVFLGVLAPWGWASWSAHPRSGDAQFGFAASLFCGVVAFLVGGVIAGVNVRRFDRTSAWADPYGYTGLIPDRALLAMDEAWESGLFSRFYVVEPAYHERPAPVRLRDPWLIGRCGADEPHTPWTDPKRCYVVLAYWE